MNEKETLAAMALARLGYYNLAAIHSLYQAAGSAAAVIEHRNNIRDLIPDASQRLVWQKGLTEAAEDLCWENEQQTLIEIYKHYE